MSIKDMQINASVAVVKSEMMIGLDVLSMTEEQSNEYFACVTTIDQAIEKILDARPAVCSLNWANDSKLNFEKYVDSIHALYLAQSNQIVHEHLYNWLQQRELHDGLPKRGNQKQDLIVPKWADELTEHLTAHVGRTQKLPKIDL